MRKIGGVLANMVAMENAAIEYDTSRVASGHPVHLLRARLNGRRSAEGMTPHLHVLSSRIGRGSSR